jgi:hypothetical protein
VVAHQHPHLLVRVRRALTKLKQLPPLFSFSASFFFMFLKRTVKLQIIVYEIRKKKSIEKLFLKSKIRLKNVFFSKIFY